MRREVILCYESNPGSGMSTLKVQSGHLPADMESAELKQKLDKEYGRLARGSVRQVEVGGHRFQVEVEPLGQNDRQPNLILRLMQAGVNSVVGESTAGWSACFFMELRELLASEVEPPLPPHEMGALAMVLDELRLLSATSDAGLGAGLLAAYLAAAEQHYRDRDKARAGVYVLARRGLGRFVPEAADPESGSCAPAAEAGSPSAPKPTRPPGNAVS